MSSICIQDYIVWKKHPYMENGGFSRIPKRKGKVEEDKSSVENNVDLENWLKASAENKITTKNTWKVPLIKYFSDIGEFRENTGINFHKASCTLNGCVKVYSTRVDDVAEDTERLLDMFSKEERKKKKKTMFLDKTFESINLKEKKFNVLSDDVYRTVIGIHKMKSVLNVIELKDECEFLYGRKKSRIVMEENQIKMNIKNLPVCNPLKTTMKKNSGSEDILREVDAADEDLEIETGEDTGGISDSCIPGFQEEELDEQKMEATNSEEIEKHGERPRKGYYLQEDTPFGYYKNWAGPNYWKKMPTQKIQKEEKPVERKKKRRWGFNFTKKLNTSALSEKGDCSLTKTQISERRKEKNLLPKDHLYSLKSLYSYLNTKECWMESFKAQKIVQEEQNPTDLPDGSMNDCSGASINECSDNSMRDFDGDISVNGYDEVKEQYMGVEKIEEAVPIRARKRVDILRLKNNMKMLLKEEKTLMGIYRRIGEFYDEKERKDISLGFCFVSMLHIANEDRIYLEESKNDVKIIETVR